LYITPESRSDADAYSTIKGSAKIHFVVISEDGTQQSDSVLAIDFDIDSKSDYGILERTEDVVILTKENSLYGVSDIYIPNEENGKPLVEGDFVCVSVSDPALTPLQISEVRLCASRTMNLTRESGCTAEGSVHTILYNSLYLMNTGIIKNEQGQGNEATFCFPMHRLSNGSHIVQVTYHSYTGDFVHEHRPESSAGLADSDSIISSIQASNEFVRFTVEKRMMLAERNVWNEGGNESPDNNLVHSETVWVDCPDGTHWSFGCDCCVSDAGISTATWTLVAVFILLVVFIAIIVLVNCKYFPDKT
jgi:hypothetical protein